MRARRWLAIGLWTAIPSAVVLAALEVWMRTGDGAHRAAAVLLWMLLVWPVDLIATAGLVFGLIAIAASFVMRHNDGGGTRP